MEILIKKIEEHGLKVTYYNKHNLWVKAQDTIIMLNSFDLFGLEDDDLMLRIKQRFYIYNIKIDLHNPDNNKSIPIKSKSKRKTYVFVTVDEKKKKIRELLTNKYKLL